MLWRRRWGAGGTRGRHEELTAAASVATPADFARARGDEDAPRNAPRRHPARRGYLYAGQLLFTALTLNLRGRCRPSVIARSPIVRDLFNGDGDSCRRRSSNVADRKTVQAFLYHLARRHRRRVRGRSAPEVAIPPVSASLDDDETAEGVTGPTPSARTEPASRAGPHVRSHRRQHRHGRAAVHELVGPHLPFGSRPARAPDHRLAHPTLLQIQRRWLHLRSFAPRSRHAPTGRACGSPGRFSEM
jgi:hypothetical protein